MPLRDPLMKGLLSISVTDKKGNEGSKELSGYFLSEISLAIDLVKKILGEKVRHNYIQLLHSPHNPFQT